MCPLVNMLRCAEAFFTGRFGIWMAASSSVTAAAAAPTVAASAAASSASALPRLLLHFDINKTVIICDPVSGTSLLQMCEVLLTEYCWGRVDGTLSEPNTLTWHCISTEPTLTPPQTADGSSAQLGRRAAGSRGSSRRGSDADAKGNGNGSGNNSPATRPKTVGAGAAAASGSPLHLSVSAAAGGRTPSPALSPLPAAAVTAQAVAQRLARLDLGAPAAAPAAAVAAAAPAASSGGGTIMSFSAFLEVRYPALPGMDDRTIALNAKAKDERRNHKRVFTQSGQPGERFAPYRVKLIDALSLPPNLPAGLSLPKPLRDGRVFLLPCFFALLQHLEHTGRDYGIVFRTFGLDLEDVSEELNRFADGTHPVYPRAQGPVWAHLRSEVVRDGGAFFRDANEPAALVWGTLDTVPPKQAKAQGLGWYATPRKPGDAASGAHHGGAGSLVSAVGAAAAAVSAALANGGGADAKSQAGFSSGVLHHHAHVAPVSPMSPAASAHEGAAAAAAAIPAAPLAITRSYEGIYRSIVSRFWPTHGGLGAGTSPATATGAVAKEAGAAGAAGAGGRVLLLHDYYPWWAANDEASDSGKLHVIDTTDTSLLSVFFDDNIEADDAHIVDARDRHTGDALDLTITSDRWTFKAEPLLSIADPHYFITALAKCERNFRTTTYAQLQAATRAKAAAAISRSASPGAAAAASPTLASRRGVLSPAPVGSSPQFGAAAANALLSKTSLAALPSPVLVTPPSSATPAADEIGAVAVAAAVKA